MRFLSLFRKKKEDDDKLFRKLSGDADCSSSVPRSIDIGNLIFEKKYEEAIKLGNDLLDACDKDNTSYLASIHINLMDAYFKARNLHESYYDLSTYHAKQAIIHGHSTGYAHIRLLINLEKQGLISQAIELCDLILNKDFTFSKHGCGNEEDFDRRKNRLLKKIDKENCNQESLFTNEELILAKKNNSQN